jgi:hypothetical protein
MAKKAGRKSTTKRALQVLDDSDSWADGPWASLANQPPPTEEQYQRMSEQIARGEPVRIPTPTEEQKAWWETYYSRFPYMDPRESKRARRDVAKKAEAQTPKHPHTWIKDERERIMEADQLGTQVTKLAQAIAGRMRTAASRGEVHRALSWGRIKNLLGEWKLGPPQPPKPPKT